MSSPPPHSTSPRITSPGRTPTPTSTSYNNVTSTPQSNAPAPVPASQPPSDPKVAELQIMFPSVEVPVIEMILESVGGSQDRAIEQLLSMTDPEFKPDELPHARTEEESQLNLDEQFARSLAMQDEQESRNQRQPRGGGGGLPYEPRVRRNRPPGQAHQQDQFYQPNRDQSPGQGGNPPGMLAVEDKLGQFAEAGKQTFNSLFNRAKAKYSEFQQQHAATVAQPDRARESSWGDTTHEPWRHPSPGPDGTPTPGGGRGGEQNRQRGGLWDERSSRSESFSSQSTIDPGPTPISPYSAANPPLRQSAARWKPSDAYDDPAPPIRRNSGSSNRIEVAGRRSPGVGSPDKGSGAIGKIDPAKLGILPKKRVDLLSTSPPPTTPVNKTLNVQGNSSNAATVEDEEDDPNPSLPSASKSLVSQIPKTPPAGHNPYTLGDSDDDLEYTKNPFDEK